MIVQLINSIKELIINSYFQSFLLFFFLPFCINFYGCFKKKRNLIYSFLLSALYPAIILLAIFVAFSIWFGTWMWIQSNFEVSIWIGMPLVMIGAFICFWCVGPIWQKTYIFFDNFKFEGIFSFDVEIARRRIKKNK